MSPIAVHETAAMPVKPATVPYSQTPETTADLEWAELVNLDLSTFDQPGGKEALAKQLNFFYVSNFGLSQDEVDYQFSIGKRIFDLPLAEKVKYGADTKSFSYNGYTGPAVYEPDSTEYDPRHNIQSYNIPKFIPDFPGKERHPPVVQENWETIERFAKTVHKNVIERLLIIFAIVLELQDEQYFVKRHLYDVRGEDPVNAEAKKLYSTGHTDLGSITLLFKQPVAGLQVLNNDGRYRWVKAVPGTADTLSLLSGRYLKSSIHRVSVPPADQKHLDRHGVLFFIRPNNDVLVEVVKDSPLLQKEGVYDTLEERENPLTVGTWVNERQKHIFKNVYNITDAGQGKEGAERAELEAEVAGIKIKYWN
ncbi:uncharacterized protein IL334_005145 [Kwoniella shivajii]|uniref:Fe2OG dioxygenase domain-containing protein n=1 Tax=Kwoniella shivajii TaxID=564305 RepID=A0ABZ1D2B6_9TREE|nr:hypothetical protein IL334_005145 [Kwoniella shivajii]